MLFTIAGELALLGSALPSLLSWTGMLLVIFAMPCIAVAFLQAVRAVMAAVSLLTGDITTEPVEAAAV